MDNETSLTIEELAERLTDLQRKVVVNVVSGDFKNNNLAYLDAVDDDMSIETARAAVSRMLAHVNVKAYKDALYLKADMEGVLRRSEMLKMLSDIARGEDIDITPESITDLATLKKLSMQAMKQFSEIEGLEAPKVIDTKSYLTIVIEDKDKDA